MANPTALDDSYPASVNQTLRIGQGEFVGQAAATRLRTNAAPGTLSSASVPFTGTGTSARVPLRSNSPTLYLGGITPTNVTTLTFSPAISGTGFPVTFAQVFKAGDVPAGASVEVLGRTTQFDIKATHPDGSVRHAIISALIDVTAGVSQLVQLRTRAPVGGVAITKANIISSAFSATATCVVGGTAYALSVRDLLDGTITPLQDVTHLSGPQCSEFIVGAKMRNGGTPHAHLAAYFHVRAYGTGGNVTSVRCDVVVENGWSFTAGATSLTYVPTITVGGATIYNNGGLSLTHYHHSRWHQVGWWGGNPQIVAHPNRTYLRDTRAVPNYASISPQESVLNSYQQSITPMSRANMLVNWPDTGYSPQIGVMPEWCAAYIMSGDIRAYNGVLANDSAGGSYSYHYRDENTGYVPSIDTYPTLSEQFPETGLVAGTGGNPNSHDDAHAPLIGYLGYMITGDYYYLEELQFLASYHMLYLNYAYRQYEKGVMYGQNRAQAWGIRTLAAAAAITPDSSPLKSYFTAKVNNNLNDRATNWSLPPTNSLGAIQDYAWTPPGSYYYAPWQNNFFVASVNLAYDFGFTSANALSLRNWLNKWPTGLMGQDNSGFCPYYAGEYNFSAGIVNGSNIYRTFLQLYQAQYPVESAQPCPTTGLMLNGYPTLATGYYSNMQPALAMAVDAGQAYLGTWNKFVSLGTADYTAAPTWGIVPRSTTGALPAWYTALATNQWTSFAAPMSAVNPCPQGGCAYSGNSGFGSIMDAWNGGAFDTNRDRLLVTGGGHSDYAGNEIYAFSLNSATPSWTRITEPTIVNGNDFNPPNNNAYYHDGAGSATHTYGSNIFDPLSDSLFKMTSSAVWGVGNSFYGVNSINLTTFTWRTNWPKPTIGDPTNAEAVYDNVRDVVWVHLSGDIGLSKFTPRTNGGNGTWTQYPTYIYKTIYTSAALDTLRNRMIIVGNSQFYLFDLNNPNNAPTTPAMSGVAGGTAMQSTTRPSIVYDPIGDRYLAWNGGSAVYAMNPTTWAWTQLTTTGVTPTSPNTQGTYGRFQYSPRLRGLVLVNSTSGNVFFMKL